MRLEPIEKPRGLLMRIAYWLSRRQLGRVMSSLRVIYARVAGGRLAGSLDRAGHGEAGSRSSPSCACSSPRRARLLNGCSVLRRSPHGAGRAGAHRAGEVQGAPRFRDQPAVLGARARGARLHRGGDAPAQRLRCRSSTALREHASEREIVEITWLNAVGNFFNLMAVPLAARVGRFHGAGAAARGKG